MNKEIQILSLTDKLKAGHYRGKTVEEMLKKDKIYLENIYFYEQYDYTDDVKTMLDLTRRKKVSEQ